MTPQQLVGLAARLFSVWLGIVSLTYFITVPRAFDAVPLDSATAIIAAYGIGVGYLVGACALWFFPMVVAHALLPRTQHENRLYFQAHELARVAGALMGLWMLSQALPSLVWVVFRALLSVDLGSSFSTLSAEAKLDISVAAVQACFALLVIFKAKVFADIVVPAKKAEAGGI
jgi:hypothetical protein